MAVDVQAGDTFSAGRPEALFNASLDDTQDFDVTPDGSRFLIPGRIGEGATSSITVEVNWRAGLERQRPYINIIYN
jgi:hypothetical protein